MGSAECGSNTQSGGEIIFKKFRGKERVDWERKSQPSDILSETVFAVVSSRNFIYLIHKHI